MDLKEVLSLLLCFIIIAIYFYQKRMSYWKDLGVAYLKPSFPYGNMNEFKEKLSESHFYLRIHLKVKALGGKFGGMFNSIIPILVVTDLDLLQNIFVKDFNYFHDRGVYHNVKHDPLSGHLFKVEGAYWKKLREKLTPTFTSGKLRNMMTTILEVGDRFEKFLKKSIEENPELDAHDVCGRFTCDIIGSCAFGIECNSFENKESAFQKIGLNVFIRRTTYLYRIIKFLTNHFPGFSKRLGLRTTQKELEDFMTKIVKNVIDYREKNNVRRNDFMDLLLDIENEDGQLDDGRNDRPGKLSVGQIVAQSFIFFVAGFESAASGMTFCLYELALNQMIQQKARDEVQSALDRFNGKLNYECLQQMTYLDQCINEILRKYPNASNLSRTVTKPYRVPGSNLVLKKGLGVVVSVFGIHHDPEIYPNPEIFDPDRFLPENVLKRHPMSFLVFGAGPRRCIGSRFSELQMKIGLAIILSNFRLEKSETEGAEIFFSTRHAILTPANKIRLKFISLSSSDPKHDEE